MPPSKKRKTLDPSGNVSSSPTSQDTDSATQRNAQNAQRKGAKQRSDKRRLDPHEAPGDPDDPRTFIEIKRNEQKLAGYLGFVNTADLRCFALSWPVAKAFMEFNDVSANLSKSKALELIRDEEDKYRKERHPHRAWPLKNKGQYGDKAKDMAKGTPAERAEYDNRCSHIAWVLLRMENDIKTYNTSSEEDNSSDTDSFLLALRNYLHVDLPRTCPGSPIPRMSHEGESRLESINRCWLVLKYIQEAKQTTSLWDNRFASAEKVFNGRTVDQSQIPHWLRRETQDGPQPTEPTQRPTSVLVIWDRESKFPDANEVEDLLRMRSDENIQIPRARQYLTQDPGKLKNGPVFRDTIRRMYNTAALGLQIRSLDLSWKNQGVLKTVDTLTTYFEDLRRIFNDEVNSDFELELLLEVSGCPARNGYETTVFVVDVQGPLDNETRGLYPKIAALHDDLDAVAAKKVVIDQNRKVLEQPGVTKVIAAYKALLEDEPAYNDKVQEIVDRVWSISHPYFRSGFKRRVTAMTGYDNWPSEDGRKEGDI